MRSLAHGKINDMPYGWISESNLNKYLYDLWSNMFSRCYKITYKGYKYFGAKGVTVCNDWCYLSKFISFIESLDVYDEFKVSFKSAQWRLQLINDYKEYNSQSCTLIKRVQTPKPVNIKKPTFIIATNLTTGEDSLFSSVPLCCLALNLTPSHVYQILNHAKNRRSHRGYTFRYKV